MSGFRSQIEFARQVPLKKLVARGRLWAKRRLLHRLRHREAAPALARHSLRINERAPLPVFSPRKSARRLNDLTYELTFLNETRHFSVPFDWHAPDLSRGTRLWKLNLHYHEFLEALSDADFLKIVSDWIETNERFRSGYWLDSWNAFSLSIRVVVWMQQIALRGLRANVLVETLIVPSLVAQMRFLERNLENDIGGNHVIKNIKALFWAGAFFSGPEAERFAQKGRRLLEAELGQILPDGMHFERSPSYHAQVFADLLEIRHAHGGDLMDGKLDNVLETMCVALLRLTHPDGGPALFNDAGLHMAYSTAECVAVYCKVLGRGPPELPGEGAFELPDAGYFGFHSTGPCLVVDCGPIAPNELPAHGHGDVLSFELSWGGHRFIVDQGVFEYDAGPRRHASRTAKNHNTLCIQGADQASFFGSFRVGRRPKPVVAEFEGGPSRFFLSGSHDGFCHLKGSPRHIRWIEASKLGLRIHDKLEGCSPLPAYVTFLLHPAVVVAKEQNCVKLVRNGVRLRFVSDKELTLEDGVWWSDMGSESRTTRVKAMLGAGRDEAAFEISVDASEDV